MSGLEIEDQIVGDGDEAVAGQTVEVHYTGWLTDVATVRPVGWRLSRS